MTFTIDAENNITAFASADAAIATGLTQFNSAAELAKVSTDWPVTRLVEIWNSIPGNAEVGKFASRKKALGKIWKAIQPLAKSADADAMPSKAKGKRKPAEKAKPAKKVATAKKGAAKTSASEPKGDRTSKKADVIAMMKRPKGVTLAEIMEATGWQAHTVRGFVSILGSKGGEKIESTKTAAGDRTYRIGK